MKTALLACAAALACVHVAHAQQPSPFQQGLSDRQKWETWFSTLSGDTKAGAEFWAGQRSLPHPGACFGPSGQDLGGFTAGCRDAQTLISPMDARRKTEPDYKAGFNAWVPGAVSTASTAPAASAPTPASAPAPAAPAPAQPTAPAAPAPAPTSPPQIFSPETREAVTGLATQARSCDEIFASSTTNAPHLIAVFHLPFTVQQFTSNDYAAWAAGKLSIYNWGYCTPQQLAQHFITAQPYPSAPVPVAPAEPAPAPNSDQLPEYNITAACGGNQECVQDAYNERALASFFWQRVSPQARATCVDSTSRFASYEMLETCLLSYSRN